MGVPYRSNFLKFFSRSVGSAKVYQVSPRLLSFFIFPASSKSHQFQLLLLVWIAGVAADVAVEKQVITAIKFVSKMQTTRQIKKQKKSRKPMTENQTELKLKPKTEAKS